MFFFSSKKNNEWLVFVAAGHRIPERAMSVYQDVVSFFLHVGTFLGIPRSDVQVVVVEHVVFIGVVLGSVCRHLFVFFYRRGPCVWRVAEA